MRKTLLSALAVVTLAVFSIVPVATAQNEESGAQRTPGANVEEKIKKYKEKYNEFVPSGEKQRIAGVCQASQTIVTNVETKVSSALTKRENAYSNIDDKLSSLVEKLKLAGVNTAELEANVAEVRSRSAVVLDGLNDYATAISVLIDMDCTDDPEAFKATLSEAREIRKSLVSSSKEFRSFVKDSLKPLLQEIRTELTGETNEKEPNEAE